MSWRRTRIGDEVTLQRGFDITKAQQRPGRVPVVSSSGVSSYHDDAKLTGPGVILGRKGTVGTVFFVNGPYWPHDTTLYVKDFKGNDERFVYYFFRAFSHRLVGLDHGTANPTLNRNHVHPIVVHWPDTPEQREIASLLGALDDKIGLNREMNRTLQAMAQALFKSWFVDFDPVVAKAAGHAPVGMDAETAALFPDRFGESDLGPIPEGWGIGLTKSMLTVSRQSVKPADQAQILFHHYSIPAYDEGKEPVVESGTGIKSNKYLIPDGCVLLAKLNPRIVRVWLPQPAGQMMRICSTEFLVCVPIEPFSQAYLSCLFRDQDYRGTLCGMVTGTSSSHQRVRPKDFERMQVVKATSRVVTAFAEYVTPLLKQAQFNDRESWQLRRIRDALLPRLLSGDLRLAELGQALEQTG